VTLKLEELWRVGEDEDVLLLWQNLCNRRINKMVLFPSDEWIKVFKEADVVVVGGGPAGFAAAVAAGADGIIDISPFTCRVIYAATSGHAADRSIRWAVSLAGPVSGTS
jgi:NADPH-dependent 2,4-dienoyl-CoA reductase/sulfur reductase-like enzyme